MNKMKMMILTAMLLAAGAVQKANATISYSTQSVAGSIMASTPTVSGRLNIVKGCNLGNPLTIATCVNLLERGPSGDTTKAIICAPASSSQAFPPVGGVTVPNSGTPGAMSQFFGEDLSFNGAFIVTSSTPSASVILTCSYSVK